MLARLGLALFFTVFAFQGHASPVLPVTESCDNVLRGFFEKACPQAGKYNEQNSNLEWDIDKNQIMMICPTADQKKLTVAVSSEEKNYCSLESIRQEGKGEIYNSKICEKYRKIETPKKDGESIDCPKQAKQFLKDKKVVVMAASYEAYIALSTDEKSEKQCRDFFMKIVEATHSGELDSGKLAYGNDKANSLDRIFTSYTNCNKTAEAYDLPEYAATKSMTVAKPHSSRKSRVVKPLRTHEIMPARDTSNGADQ
jgi:hypothetical protein